MNPGEIRRTTTEINTEIKVEVKLETASITKVERSKSPNPATIKALTMEEPKPGSEKTREDIKAEREAKKLAKQAKKGKSASGDAPQQPAKKAEEVSVSIAANTSESDKSRDQIKAEREAKKLAKQNAKAAKSANVEGVTEQLAEIKINSTAESQHQGKVEEKKKPTLTKAERRAIQEAQRAAKTQAQTQKTGGVAATAKKDAGKQTSTTEKTVAKKVTSGTAPNTLSPKTASTNAKRATSNSPVKLVRFNDGNVRLFSHLEKAATNVNLFINNPHLHPSIARLGEQYAKRTVVGSNARCIAFLNAVKLVIQDFETPAKKEFARSLEAFISNCVDYLQKCRTLAVSVINAHKNLNQVIMQLPNDQPESELKEKLFNFIDTYIENQIGKAAQAINAMVQKKINNGDIILTFGCSSLITYICEEALARKVDFRVIVVDSRPFCEGQELLRRLTAKNIPCSYVLINAVSFVMPEVTKVLLGAHALLANGYVMARTGTAQVALVARSFNVPVLVCCETHKFSERFQTDAIVYNELGNPDDIVVDEKCCLSNWQAKHKMSPLNLNYDITPPELVTAVITEVSVLPCTSVPVILRMKPDWLMYAS